MQQKTGLLPSRATSRWPRISAGYSGETKAALAIIIYVGVENLLRPDGPDAALAIDVDFRPCARSRLCHRFEGKLAGIRP